jgi:hypothetical protein
MGMDPEPTLLAFAYPLFLWLVFSSRFLVGLSFSNRTILLSACLLFRPYCWVRPFLPMRSGMESRRW